MDLKPENGIGDEEEAEYGEALSCAQQEQRQPRDKRAYRKSTIQ